MLDGGDRRDRDIVQRANDHPRVHELIGIERLVRIGEIRPQLQGPGGRVDQIVQARQRSGRDQLVVGAIVSRDGQRLSLSDLLPNHADVVFGENEHDRDRFDLSEDHEAGRVRCLDVIARIDQSQPDASGDRRDDATVADVEIRRIDVGLVLLNQSLVLRDQEFLVGDLLQRDAVLLAQGLVAGKVRLGLFKQPGVVGERALGEGERRLVRPVVDLGEEIPLVDELTFLEADLHQLAVDLGLDGDREERRHRSQAGQRVVDVARDDLRRPDRLGLLDRALLDRLGGEQPPYAHSDRRNDEQ